MKRDLHIAFVGFSENAAIEDRYVYKLIARRYHIVLDSCCPDYVIDYANCRYRYDNAINIQYSGENSAPDFNAYDYAIGFDNVDFGDRYLRSPLYARWRGFDMLTERLNSRHDESLLNRKFCSFVVSNSNYCDPIREKFFNRLSQYKKVDSGGRYLNNIGGPVKDKLEFCRGYKFNIAFENSAYPGYTTEKIMEAYAAETVPIYFGNPTIETDFRLESMVRVKDESDIERAVEEIIRLDNDDEAYLAKCHERCFAVEDPMVYERELEAFLVHIFEQPLEQARRRARYGHQAMMREHMRKLVKIDQFIGKARRVLHV